MKHIVVTEELHEDGRAMLATREDLNITYLNGDRSKLPEALKTAHGVIVRSFELDEDQLQLAPDLEIVCRHGVGCDNIAVDYLSGRNIPVAIAVNSNTISVVEHVMMMMLALNKRAFEYDGLTRSGHWSQRGKRRTSELAGKHVVIIGFGRIGKKVAPVCKAFGMRVTVADIELDKALADTLDCQGVEDFRPHLADADYVTVHVPLDENTRHLIGEQELAMMPSHCIMINCARGGIVDEAALAAAINSGKLAATGSDVFATEPPEPDNPLLDLPNSIYTPHNAAGTNESMSRMATYSVRNLFDHLDGKLDAEFVFNFDKLNP